MHKIKEMLLKELEEYEKKGNISMNSLDVIHKMTDTIKNIDKIEMLKDEQYNREYSRDGMWMAKGSYGNYDDGSSYARKHYVRGHYSRDGENYSSDNDYSERRGYSNRYSRDESRDTMTRAFDEILAAAKTPEERETLKRCMETVKGY